MPITIIAVIWNCCFDYSRRYMSSGTLRLILHSYAFVVCDTLYFSKSKSTLHRLMFNGYVTVSAYNAVALFGGVYFAEFLLLGVLLIILTFASHWLSQNLGPAVSLVRIRKLLVWATL